MTIRMKKTGIFLLGCLLAVSLLLCGVLFYAIYSPLLQVMQGFGV